MKLSKEQIEDLGKLPVQDLLQLLDGLVLALPDDPHGRLLLSSALTIRKLQDDLAVSEKNVKDFETLAHEWKEAHTTLELKYRRDLGNLVMEIEELEEELESAKSHGDDEGSYSF